MGPRLLKRFGSSVKRASKVKYTFKSQVVEAIRISYELAGNATDAEIHTTLVALESVIEAAVDTEGQPEKTTPEKLSEFVSCLKNDSMKERMAAAQSKDKLNVTQSAVQSLRLDSLLEKVKKSPLLRSKHFFVVAEPRTDVTVEIPYDAKLPDIRWKFHRVCGKDTPSNPHFYPYTAFEEEDITQIPPLRDRNANKNGAEWTERIFVYGDNKEGHIRLTSEDETITRLFGAVTQCLVRPLTLFKDIEGHLLAEEEVDQVFMSARNLKCFRWQDSSFEIDPDVKTVQDVINYSRERIFASSPLSMEPTDFRPPELRHATSVISTTRSGGYYRVNQPFSVGTSSSLSVAGPQGLMGYDVPHIPGNDPLHIPIGVVSKPPWQQVSSGSPSIPIAPLHTVPADPSPQPPHPPPTTPGPAKDQSHSPSVTPEKAEIQVGPAEKAKLSTATSMATAGSQRDGAPTVDHKQRGSPAVDIPQPIRQSRPPLLVPTRSSSQNGSIISSSPAPSSLCSSHVDTPLSTVTALLPGPFNHPQTSFSHSPPASLGASENKPLSGSSTGLYGTATLHRPNPSQTSQSTPTQSPPSPMLSSSSSPPTSKGPEKPSPPPQQARRDNRSFWRRTVDGVSDWWSGPKK